VYAVGAAFVGGVADVAKFVTGVNQKIGNVLTTIGEIPGKAVAALGQLGKTLWSAGSALIQGLIDGVTAKLGDLKDKLTSVTNMIPDWKGPESKDKVLLTPAGEALMEGLIAGIEKKKTKLQTVLEKITDEIKKRQDKLAELLDNRQSIVDSFRGFATSVFGADMGDADNPATAQSLVDHSAGQRSRAETLSTDVQALIDKGLSKDLINELIASGQSGMDQIHLLAGATAEQIAAVNANQAATQAALQAAGLAAADAVMGEQVAQAARDVALADSIRDKLKELMDQQDKNTIMQLVLDGKVIHASLLKLKKAKNSKLELD
jgi:phage-related protein